MCVWGGACMIDFGEMMLTGDGVRRVCGGQGAEGTAVRVVRQLRC